MAFQRELVVMKDRQRIRHIYELGSHSGFSLFALGHEADYSLLGEKTLVAYSTLFISPLEVEDCGNQWAT